MTAYHCGIHTSQAPTLVTYWNFNSPTCGQQGGGSLAQFLTGSTLRAESSASDFTLVELNSVPDASWNVAYAGWDRGAQDPTSATAIHHPSTDEKSISFEYDALSTTTYLQTAVPGDGTHLRVADWDLGTTEGGSSGSPLFNQNHHVVGQLHGGYAACGNNLSDWYGRFSRSWTGGTRPRRATAATVKRTPACRRSTCWPPTPAACGSLRLPACPRRAMSAAHSRPRARTTRCPTPATPRSATWSRPTSPG
ncbi:MAG: trypsin-like peptidase domain-containing protein [bacterium]|nr:trypsin-like peptidase domain-containing protein [bacterium]